MKAEGAEAVRELILTYVTVSLDIRYEKTIIRSLEREQVRTCIVSAKTQSLFVPVHHNRPIDHHSERGKLFPIFGGFFSSYPIHNTSRDFQGSGRGQPGSRTAMNQAGKEFIHSIQLGDQ